jgi:(p)ppGpp synthase/HD superfamily hydrolase
LVAFTTAAHAGQFYKPGVPYTFHLIGVLDRLLSYFPEADDDLRHAALLHDVLEDTPTTADDLLARGYGPATVTMVQLVTNPPGETLAYADKIARLIATGNRGAMQVKLADMSFNADPAHMTDLEPARVALYQAKYAKPLAMLKAALGVSDSGLAPEAQFSSQGPRGAD